MHTDEAVTDFMLNLGAFFCADCKRWIWNIGPTRMAVIRTYGRVCLDCAKTITERP